MTSKRGGVRWGVLAGAVGLLGLSACATQEQFDHLANEVQQLRARSAHREAELEATTRRLSALQDELDRGGDGNRAEVLDTLRRLVESNESLRTAVLARDGKAVPHAETKQSLAPAADERELKQLVQELRTIVYGRETLTSQQQLLLLRALRPQRELDRDNPWEPRLDRGNPWH